MTASLLAAKIQLATTTSTFYHTKDWTLRHLRRERRRDGDKVEVGGPVVDWHLLAPAQVTVIAVALVAELLQAEAAVHQYACSIPGRTWLEIKGLTTGQGQEEGGPEVCLYFQHCDA